MLQLGCQDLWHTYYEIETTKTGERKNETRLIHSSIFPDPVNIPLNSNRTIIEIIKNSLKTFFQNAE